MLVLFLRRRRRPLMTVFLMNVLFVACASCLPPYLRYSFSSSSKSSSSSSSSSFHHSSGSGSVKSLNSFPLFLLSHALSKPLLTIFSPTSAPATITPTYTGVLDCCFLCRCFLCRRRSWTKEDISSREFYTKDHSSSGQTFTIKKERKKTKERRRRRREDDTRENL